MSLRWRWSLVVVLAAIVLGGFMPQALLRGTHDAPSQIAMARSGPPTFPSGCVGADCGKSAPVAPTPLLTIAALAAMTGVVIQAAGGRLSRWIAALVRALPRGTVPVLFRPPQFS